MARLLTRPFRLCMAALAGTFVLCLLASALVFRLQMGKMTHETAVRCSSIEAKMQLIQSLPSPKFVFLGGSSVHKGVNAGIFSSALGVPAGNFGTLAQLGPKLILYNGRQLLKRGDTAVLIMEYALYSGNGPTAAEIDYTLGCGDGYFGRLSIKEKLAFILAANPLRSLTARVWPIQRDVSEQKRRLTSYGDGRFIPLNFHKQTEAQQARMRLYQAVDVRVDLSSRDARSIVEFVDWARSNGVNVVATWPNTLAFREYHGMKGLKEIEAFYRGMNVPLVGTPERAMFSLDRLHDTQHHLNEVGILERTKRLLEDFSRIEASLATVPKRADDI